MTIEEAKEVVKAFEQEPCDCISRQAVLDLPRIKTHNQWGNVICESIDVENVRQLPPVMPQPKWIPVSERLPEEYTYTLWCSLGGNVQSDYFNGEVWEDAEKYGYEVIAWMPLPQPYKEKE